MVRVKNRYLVVNFLYPAPPGSQAKRDQALPDLVQFHAPTPDAFHTGLLLRLIRDGVNELFGDYGTAMVNNALKVNYWSPATSTAIIRCPRDNFEMVWAALTFVTKLPRPVDLPVVVKVVRVSGTIKKAEEEVIKRAKLIIRRAKAAESGPRDEIVESAVKAVEKRREEENQVLTRVDDDDESGSD
ncbi:hypothetical protein DM02DRAFT_504356, partial [Periconia macrospinosa]